MSKSSLSQLLSIEELPGEFGVVEQASSSLFKEIFLKKYDNELNTLRERINFYEQLKAAIEDYKEDAKC